MEPMEEDVEVSVRPPSRSPSIMSSLASLRGDLADETKWRNSPWRHPLGIFLLLITVFLWTAGNFLASTIFADNTYSKPYFVTYLNSFFFNIPLVPLLLREYRNDPTEIRSILSDFRAALRSSSEHIGYSRLETQENDDSDPISKSTETLQPTTSTRLSLRETAKLSLSFSLLWFSANYFAIACLEYTTVGSATILTSTSSVWTLLSGTYAGVERFTLKKLLGVLASLAGIVLISTLDVSAPDNTNRGTFPSKTAHEIAIGDALAFVSAVIYGVYAVVLKKKVGDESRVNMPLFFGFVGAWNVLLMWPPFILLHFTGIERFEMPPTSRVVLILVINSLSSVLSDFCWAFAMLLTSPLVVTVGLSLTIPLSLVGQMIIDGVYTSFVYWLGAAVVVASFVFVNHEEIKDEEHDGQEPAGLMRSEVGWTD